MNEHTHGRVMMRNGLLTLLLVAIITAAIALTSSEGVSPVVYVIAAVVAIAALGYTLAGATRAQRQRGPKN